MSAGDGNEPTNKLDALNGQANELKRSEDRIRLMQAGADVCLLEIESLFAHFAVWPNSIDPRGKPTLESHADHLVRRARELLPDLVKALESEGRRYEAMHEEVAQKAREEEERERLAGRWTRDLGVEDGGRQDE